MAVLNNKAEYTTAACGGRGGGVVYVTHVGGLSGDGARPDRFT